VDREEQDLQVQVDREELLGQVLLEEPVPQTLMLAEDPELLEDRILLPQLVNQQ
jgi:hypothetical protein